MNIRFDILVGVAASALFYLIQKYLVDLKWPWDVVSSLGIFGIAVIAAMIVRHRPAGAASLPAVLSNMDVRRDLTARIDGVEATSRATVMSDLKVGGNADLEIRNTKL